MAAKPKLALIQPTSIPASSRIMGGPVTIRMSAICPSGT